MKWLACAAYCHPVLIKIVEKTFSTLLADKGIFNKLDQVEDNLINRLEIINVLCLVKGFDLSVLKIY